MTLPRQQFGLNKFSTSVSQCPFNADSVKAIVFQRNNLAVVNGPSTEMELVLSDFFSTINSASKFSFTIPGSTSSSIPYQIYKIDNDEQNIKLLAILPSYGTVSNTNEFIEWTPMNSIDNGVLYDEPIVGPMAEYGISFDISKVNCLEFGWGRNISYTGGTGPLWVGTDGGLLKWDNTDMKLWNTLNSQSPSDYISSIAVDAYDNLWIGSSKGLSKFNENTGFSQTYNSENSSLLSDKINDIKLLSTDKIAIGTDMGMSIFNFNANTWESFDIYTTPQLLYNDVNKLAVKNSKILLGTTGGVFMYDSATLTWNSAPFNSVNTTGWTAPDDVKALVVNGTNVYVGTTNGLVIFSYSGGTAQTVTAGPTGPISSNIISLKTVKYGLNEELYVGHDDGISVFDITNGQWIFTADSSTYSQINNVRDILPDFLSGSTGGKTIFFGNSSGLNKIFTIGPTFSVVPEASKSTNLLMVYPNTLGLYPSLQPQYFIFSKPMNAISFESKVIFKDELTSSLCNTHGATVSGTWTWTNANKVASLSSSLLKATPYSLRVNFGATAQDSSYLKENFYLKYYTENVAPEGGWLPLGKLMILTGTNDKFFPGIYIRNPQNFDVTLSILAGII